MLETQNSTPVTTAPFLEAHSSDTKRQALPIPLAGKPAFSGLMSAMAAENLPKGLPVTATAVPGFAAIPLSSSSDLVLAQLGVKSLSAEELELSEQALASLNLAENLTGLLKDGSDLPTLATVTEQGADVENLSVSPAVVPALALPVEKVQLDAQANLVTPSVASAQVVHAASLESVMPGKSLLTGTTNEHELISEVDSSELINNAALLPQESLPADKAITAPAASATLSQTVQTDVMVSVAEMAAPAAEESAELVEPDLNVAASAQTVNDAGQQTLQTSEKLSGSFDKIAPKVDRAETTTTWGTQTQTAAAAGQAASAASSQGGQPGQQQGQGQQAQQQAMTQQLQQAQLSAEQQVKNRFAEEMTAVKAVESADKDRAASLLGDLGSGFDKRAHLPLAMQSINTPVRHSQWGQALGQRVVVMANLKIQDAKIMLNPERLGPVQVKLHMDKDQQIHVTMLAQHGTTREAMENAVPKLKEMLEQAGINFGSVDVGDHRDFEQAQKDSAPHKGHQSGTGGASADDDSVEPSPVHLSTTNNLIDYYA